MADNRRLHNLIELLSDSYPEVAAPPAHAAICWSEQEIREYFSSGGKKLGTSKAGATEGRGASSDGKPPVKLRCQRIGCDASYIEDDNPEGACSYHPGPPVFHDGGKEWGCCKMRSHDFSTFMSFKGCKTGMHTQEKPAPLFKSTAQPMLSPMAKTIEQKAADTTSAQSCNRCRQGFFCSDHQSAPQPAKPAPAPAQPKAPVDPEAEQTCKNKGCGIKFKEIENKDDACSFHPGPPVFHERQKGWACCNKLVYDFDEFLKIPNCAKGRHNADPDGMEGYGKTKK